MADETKVMEAILGPYRGKRLTMLVADADQGRDDHWLINPFDPVAYDHPVLTEEERAASIVAADAWAKLQWDTAQGITPPPPPPEGGATRRSRTLQPEAAGDYKTR